MMLVGRLQFNFRRLKPRRGRGFLLFAVMIGFLTTPAHADDDLIKKLWVNGFKSATSQIVSGSLYMTGAIGGMIDGATVNEYHRVMQRLHAAALRDYTPGENLCRLGTLSRSLAASNHNALTAKMALQTILLDRETSNGFRSRPYAEQDDLARLNTLSELYCNPGDNDKVPTTCNCDLAAGTCSTTNGPISPRSNRDLDLSRLFDQQMTMKLDFTNSGLSADEQDLLAFFSNIAGYKSFPAITPNENVMESSPIAAKTFLDMRNIIASRGLIRDSIATQASQKAPGADGSTIFLKNALRELGMSDDEAKRYLKSDGVILTRTGSDATLEVSPSYNAQMEILTKKIYQNPNFYVNLVDKPANIERTRAALTAISLMQRRDMKEMLDRRELLLSQMLEYDIRNEEQYTRKRIRQATAGGN